MIPNEKAETSDDSNDDCILNNQSFICNNFFSEEQSLRTSVNNVSLSLSLSWHVCIKSMCVKVFSFLGFSRILSDAQWLEYDHEVQGGFCHDDSDQIIVEQGLRHKQIFCMICFNKISSYKKIKQSELWIHICSHMLVLDKTCK